MSSAISMKKAARIEGSPSLAPYVYTAAEERRRGEIPDEAPAIVLAADAATTAPPEPAAVTYDNDDECGDVDEMEERLQNLMTRLEEVFDVVGMRDSSAEGEDVYNGWRQRTLYKQAALQMEEAQRAAAAQQCIEREDFVRGVESLLWGVVERVDVVSQQRQIEAECQQKLHLDSLINQEAAARELRRVEQLAEEQRLRDERTVQMGPFFQETMKRLRAEDERTAQKDEEELALLAQKLEKLQQRRSVDVSSR